MFNELKTMNFSDPECEEKINKAIKALKEVYEECGFELKEIQAIKKSDGNPTPLDSICGKILGIRVCIRIAE